MSNYQVGWRTRSLGSSRIHGAKINFVTHCLRLSHLGHYFLVGRQVQATWPLVGVTEANASAQNTQSNSGRGCSFDFERTNPFRFYPLPARLLKHTVRSNKMFYDTAFIYSPESHESLQPVQKQTTRWLVCHLEAQSDPSKGSARIFVILQLAQASHRACWK